MLNAKPLPDSSRRYYLTDTQDVVDGDGYKIITMDIDGIPHIELDWFLGKRWYELGYVLLVCDSQIENDYRLFENIVVVYKDGDKRNVFLINLTFTYKALPYKSDIADFYRVPGYWNVGIREDGTAINLKTLKSYVWYKIKGKSQGTRRDGYEATSVQLENRGTKTLLKHRSLALAFIPMYDYYANMIVNHKDGDKSKTVVDNLEWCTYSENLKHAWDQKLRNQIRPKVLCKNLFTNEIIVFDSVRKASEYFGDVSAFYISIRLKDRSGGIYPDYLMFKRDDGSDWPMVDYNKIPKVGIAYRNNIVAKNVFDGSLMILENAEQGEKMLGISASVALDHARNNKNLPYKGYNFRYKINLDSMPTHAYRALLIFKEHPVRPPAGVIMTDRLTGQESFFTSAEKCCKEVGIAMAHLRTLTFSGRLFNKKYAFVMYKIKEQ